MLSDKLVAGREVEDDISSCKCKIVTWRCGCPYILADLNAELNAIAGYKYLWLGRHLNRAACEIDFGWVQVLRRSKPALLVELTVIGQIYLWHNAQQCSALQNGSAVIQQTVYHNWQTNYNDGVELAGEIKQFYYTLLSMVEKKLLLEQILTRIASDAELWEHDNLNSTILGLSYQTLNLLNVIFHIGHLNRGNSCCNVYKSVFHSFTF